MDKNKLQKRKILTPNARLSILFLQKTIIMASTNDKTKTAYRIPMEDNNHKSGT